MFKCECVCVCDTIMFGCVIIHLTILNKENIFAQLYSVYVQMNTEHLLYNVLLNHACDMMCVHVQAVVIVVLIVFLNLVL